MKVLFVQDTLINAGTEKSLLNILPYVTSNLEAKVVYLYPRHDLQEDYSRAGISMIFLDLKGKYDFVNGIKKLFKLVKVEEPDLLVSSLLRSNLLSRFVSYKTGIPLVGTFVSDSYHPDSNLSRTKSQRLKSGIFKILDKWSSNIPIKFISNSEAIAKAHLKTLGVPFEKSVVVYRGRQIPSQSWSKPNNEFYTFLSYGRLIPLKGFEELIKAFSRVYQKFPQTQLIIYGEGNYRTQLEKLILDLDLIDSVKLPGVNKEVTKELYKSDCFVFPSWYEGFSGSLVEAMLSGIPIIASDIPMNLEAISPDETALTFPVKDLDALAAKMVWAIQNQNAMAELGKAAREVAKERFDIREIAAKYEQTLFDIYHESQATQ